MPNEQHITELRIAGFKSIKDIRLKLNNINILVGANGSGKSNLLSFFKMLKCISHAKLQQYMLDNGGIGDILFKGIEYTSEMIFEVYFSTFNANFKIHAGLNDKFGFEITNTGINKNINPQSQKIKKKKSNKPLEELFKFIPALTPLFLKKELITGLPNGLIALGLVAIIAQNNNSERVNKAYTELKDIVGEPLWQVYYFMNTTSKAPMCRYEIIQDNAYLREDAANIAPFLLSIKNEHPNYYQEIIYAIRAVAPFFDDFILKPRMFEQAEKVNLSWTQKGSDYPMQPYHLSDGTLRFICLATALLQPNPPATIIIDEPELGLHPAAIAMLAELIQAAARTSQIIIATQSPLLIDYFTVEDLIVASREDGASTFTRLKEEDFTMWLEDYSLGELLRKDVIEGGPIYE